MVRVKGPCVVPPLDRRPIFHSTACLALWRFFRESHVLIRRYMDENRHDSVDIHPRRFEPGICARNFSEDVQHDDGREEEQDGMDPEQGELKDE
jgi:hypothetical protein